MSLIYSNDDEKDLKKLDGVDDYEDENEGEDEGEDEGEEDSQQDSGMGMPGKGKGFGNFLGKAGKIIKKIAKVIAMLPLPLRIAVIVFITGFITALVMEINNMAATDNTTSSVNSSVSNMKEQASSGQVIKEDGTVVTLTEEERQKVQQAVDFFEKNNSYLYFTIGNITDVYNNFVKEYTTSTDDIGSKLYQSYTTEYGSVDLDETSKTQRIVDPNQKLPLYIHLLMTEKYNFNAVEWKWYGHGHSGEDLSTSNITEDKELGLKYPNDGRTELSTFIDLLSPYMLTWHIPLGFHSGFLTKSGSNKQASAFTYNIVKDAYSDIVAHRYDVQKRTTETKYDEYTENICTSDFDVTVEISYEYRPIPDGNYDLECTLKEDSSKTTVIYNFDKTGEYASIIGGNYTLYLEESISSDTDKYVILSNKNNKIVSQAELNGYINQFNNTAQYIYNENNINETFASVTEDGEYVATRYRYDLVNVNFTSSTPVKKIVIEKKIFTYGIKVIASGEPKKDANGNILYNLYASYKYGKKVINEPNISSSKEVNKRLDSNGNVDVMLEEVVQDRVTITNKYYVKEANTFDVKIKNEFSYIPYNEADSNNRKNAKSERQHDLQDYQNVINPENKITEENIENYVNLNNTLAYLESTFNAASGSNFENYSYIKNTAPNTITKIQTEVTLPDRLKYKQDGLNKVTNSALHNINYEGKNTYTEQIGLAKDGKGTHYILRIWEDTLTQRSTRTTTYTEEDLIEFNAKYNSELNGTNLQAEKDSYKKLTEKEKTSYSDYKNLAAQKLLSTVDLINSNENIYDEYLINTTPQSKITGHSRSYIDLALNEVKRLFKETEAQNGTIPYLYGVSLGFTNILTENSTRKMNASSKMFIWPIPSYEYVSYIFGYSAAYSGGTYTNIGSYGLHTGIDLSIGDVEVLAAADGTVIACENTIADGTYIESSYGNYVLIEHENGYATLYSHLASDVRFTLGQEVTQGDVVGITNTTGSSTGKHLHYEIRKSSDDSTKFTDSGVANAFSFYSEQIDPLEFYVVEPANGNTIEYDELLLNPALGEQITMQDAYKFVGYVSSGVADEEFLGMLHSWEGGVGKDNVKTENGIQYYKIHDDGYGHATVGRGVDINASGFKDRFVAAGYPTEIGGWVPSDFVDALESEELLSKEESIRAKLAGIELTDYQWQAMISRAYNCGAAGATYTRPRNDPAGLNFIEAYNKYWVGNETTEIDFEHPFFVNYMKYPETSEGKVSLGLQRRRRAEWILFTTGTVSNNGDERTGLY